MARVIRRWVAFLALALMLPTATEACASSGALGAKGTDLIVADATALPPTLDPFKVYGTQTQSFFRLFFEPLFDRDPDGKIRTPLLERWGAVDRLTWEFRLRPGVRFHDGGQLTSADVVYSLERILNPESSRRLCLVAMGLAHHALNRVPLDGFEVRVVDSHRRRRP